MRVLVACMNPRFLHRTKFRVFTGKAIIPVRAGGAPIDFRTFFVSPDTCSATPHSSHTTAYLITSSA